MSDELATLRVRARDDIVMAVIEGEIDLLLDLTGLEFLDSSGVHMLYDMSDRLATRQQQFAVVLEAEAPPRRAIELSGVEPAAWLHADLTSALAALGA